MPSIEELQAQLQAEIIALAEQRKKEAEKAEKDAQEKMELEDLERKEKIETLRKRQESIRAQREAERLASENEHREFLKKKAEKEAAQSAAIAAEEERARKMLELQIKVANEEFIKEQHIKKIESIKAMRTSKPEEYPIAPVNSRNPGDAVEGTGGVEESATMTPHLRHILRQDR